MVDNRKPIEAIIDDEMSSDASAPSAGVVSGMLAKYGTLDRSSLLGFLLKMDYDELTVVTCDA